MPPLFFQPGITADPVYAHVRDAPPDGDILDRARGFIERIWSATSEYVDVDAPLKAQRDLLPVFWEMYLARALLLSGIVLVPRAKRRLANNKGPDLATLEPAVSIEAVMPGNGSGPDGISRPQTGIAYDVPQEQMMLRIRSVIEDKALKLRSYIDEEIISPTEPTVISISGAKLEFRLQEACTPYVVRAALAIGNTILHIDKKTKQAVGQSVDFQDTIRKTNNAPVRIDPFLGQQFSHVSALLYSAADFCWDPAAKGEEFIIVRNSFADNPLPSGWPGIGTEFWKEGEKLRSRLFNPEDP